MDSFQEQFRFFKPKQTYFKQPMALITKTALNQFSGYVLCQPLNKIFELTQPMIYSLESKL